MQRFITKLLILSFPLTALAGGGDHHTSDTDVSVDVGGDTVNVGGDTVNVGGDTISMQGGDLTSGPVNVSTGGNKSLALGNVLGDVDIGDCLGSTQWSTPVYGKQKLVVNWVCMAEQYLRWGQPELAAMALCNTDIKKEFASEEECEQAHQFLTAAMVAAVEPAAGSDKDEEESWHEEQLMLQADLKAKVENLEAEIAKARPTPPPKTIIEQKPLLTESQRAKLLELKK